MLILQKKSARFAIKMTKNNIAFDTNIWIGFSIGKRLSYLQTILLSKDYSIYYCDELVREYCEVARRKNLSKYISGQRIADTIDLMEQFTIPVKIISKMVHPTDLKDSYLLSLCVDAQLDYLITGDKDLLKMKKFHNTEMITFRQFIVIQGLQW